MLPKKWSNTVNCYELSTGESTANRILSMAEDRGAAGGKEC